MSTPSPSIANPEPAGTAPPRTVAPSSRVLWDGLLAPLNLAAYAILGLIAYNQLGDADHGSRRWVLAATLLVFLLAYVGGELLSRRLRNTRWHGFSLIVQVAAALTNLSVVYDGMNPILLVLVAAQLPTFVPLPLAMAVLVGLDAVAYLLLREVHGQSRPLFNIAVYATFQAFAMLTAWFAYRAEQANRELAAVNAHLLATRSLLEEGARDGERLRLSRELHDVAGHTLTALKLHLELAQRHPDEAQRRTRIDAAHGLAEDLLQDIRSVVSQLRRYDGIDLPAALATLCQGFPGVEVKLEVESDLRLADVDRAEALLRAAQEALTNAVRHGQARRIAVRVQRQGDQVRLDVIDDGRGSSVLSFGNGLTGMRERLRGHGGNLDVDSAAGRGLHLSATLIDPLPGTS